MAALADASSELVPGFVFEGHRSWVWSVTSHEEEGGSPESLRLVSSADDAYVCIWRGGSLRRLHHEGRVFCVKVFQDPEGLWLIASTGNFGILKVSRHGAVCRPAVSSLQDRLSQHRISTLPNDGHSMTGLC
jgi:WD40 repeat protein